MRIEIDYDFDVAGNVLAVHVFHTENAAWNVADHPDGVTGKVPAITALLAHSKNPAFLTRSGWTTPTKHPAHNGKTRFETFLAEIVRLNDAPARALFGV